MSIAGGGPVLRELVFDVGGTHVMVRKLEDDPICPRASFGGTPEEGFYLTYRGDEETVRNLIAKCMVAYAHSLLGPPFGPKR